MEQDNYVQKNAIPIIPTLDMISTRLFLSEEEIFIKKEQYLNQYRENNFWVMLPMRKVNTFFNYVSYQGANEKIIEEQRLARQRITNKLVDSVRHQVFNDLCKNTYVKLEEKDVTTMLQSNVVVIPI